MPGCCLNPLVLACGRMLPWWRVVFRVFAGKPTHRATTHRCAHAVPVLCSLGLLPESLYVFQWRPDVDTKLDIVPSQKGPEA